MDPNVIAAELLCSISGTLPLDPVVAGDGSLYERSKMEDERVVHQSPHIKRVIEHLVSSGGVDSRYLGGWAKELQKKEFLLAKRRAEAGDARSMVALGELYMKGAGTEKDEGEGYKWFCLASDKGCGLGSSRRADCLIAGLGVQRDVKEGRQTLVEASLEGDNPVPALLRLWCLHGEGISGFERNESKAAKYLTKLKEKSGLDDSDLHRMKQDFLDVHGPSQATAEQSRETLATPKQAADASVGEQQELSSNEDDQAKHFAADIEVEPNPPQPEGNAAKEATSTLIPSSTQGIGPKKECHSCHVAKRKAEYELTQWTKTQRTGICIDCCKKASADGVAEKGGSPNDGGGPTQVSSSNTATNSQSEGKKDGMSLSDQDPTSAALGLGATPPDNAFAMEDAVLEDTPASSAPKGTTTEEKDSTKDEDSTPATRQPSIPSPAGTVCKQCYSCHQFKPQGAFSTSQWNRPERTCDACSQGATGPKAGCSKEAPPPSNDDSVQRDHSQQQPGVSAPVKTCFECHQPKIQAEFTASQWKRRLGTGRCTACVSKSIQWQTGSVGSSLQLKACGECGIRKQHPDFSPNQWKKKVGTGRCKACVHKSLFGS